MTADNPAGLFKRTAPHPGYGPYAAVVLGIVDGDTLDVLVDVGFNDYLIRRLRLVGAGMRGLDAPEVRGPTRDAGRAATAWLQGVLPILSNVTITTAKDPDSFGRYLAAVRIDDGRDIGGLMVMAGHAVWRDYR